MMRGYVSGHETTLSVPCSPDHSRAARRKEEKEREKEKAKDDPKGPDEHSLMMDKRKILNGKKRTSFGAPKEREARRACQKASMVSIRVVFALINRTKVQASTFTKTKAEERIEKGKSKEGTCLQSGFSSSETPHEEGYGQVWEPDDWSASHWTVNSWTPDAGWLCTKAHTAWMVATPLNLANHPTHVVLDCGCTRTIGSRAAIERFRKHAWYCGITTEFCRCNTSFVFANSESETCKERCIIHFPTIPQCSAKVDALETGDVPILFSLFQMKNLGMTFELVPKGDQITCPAFGLYSCPAEHSTMAHIVLDLTTIAHQSTTKSRQQSGHPKRHVTFVMYERRPASPAHAPDMHEDEDEDDKPLVRPASRKEPRVI